MLENCINESDGMEGNDDDKYNMPSDAELMFYAVMQIVVYFVLLYCELEYPTIQFLFRS